MTPVYAEPVRLSLLLTLLAAPACLPDPPAVVLGGEGCDAIDLAVLDPAVLPGWIVHSLVAQRDDGDAVWTLATDPEGALTLKSWPGAPILGLADVGDAADFSLIPGRVDGESWMLLDRQEHLRVWRLGSAADGEFFASPDLSGFPGPGGWSYSLHLIGDAPYLLAAATGVPVKSMRFHLARLDPDDLSLGPAGPVIRFADLCMPPSELPCSTFTTSTALAEVDALAATEAGTMAGAAVLLGVTFATDASPLSGFVVLQMNDHGSDLSPTIVGRIIGQMQPYGVPDTLAPRLHGRLASNGEYLFASMIGQEADDPDPPAAYMHSYLRLADHDSPAHASYSTRNGPSLQFGREAVMSGLEDGRWEIELLKRDTSLTADLVLPNRTQVWSAGHGQWFARPPGGPAMRLGASCVPRDASE